MSISIALSSNGHADSSDFTTTLDQTLQLGDLRWTVALQKFDAINSVFNIFSSGTNQNNKIYYYNGSVNREITLNAGRYEIADINRDLQYNMVNFGDYTVVNNENVFSLEIGASFNTGRATVYIKSGSNYTFTFGANSLWKYLGFNLNQVLTQTTNGPNPADVSGGIVSYLIHCSLAQGKSSMNGKSSDILWQFSGSGKAPYDFISIEPYNPPEIQINTTSISNIRMRITDQDNNAINFNGEQTAYLLVIKRNTDL